MGPPVVFWLESVLLIFLVFCVVFFFLCLCYLLFLFCLFVFCIFVLFLVPLAACVSGLCIPDAFLIALSILYEK